MDALQQAMDSLQRLKVDFIKITDKSIKPEVCLAAIKAAVKADVRLDANPLNDIASTQKMHSVIVKCRYLSRATLNTVLVKTAAKAAASRFESVA
ncbi:MAG: hypothetical protein ABIQ88_22710 [Chitinophagaceae bacterium]